jgi:hypothetical protein
LFLISLVALSLGATEGDDHCDIVFFAALLPYSVKCLFELALVWCLLTTSSGGAKLIFGRLYDGSGQLCSLTFPPQLFVHFPVVFDDGKDLMGE